MKETLGALEQCIASHGGTPAPDSVRELLDSAHKNLSGRQRPTSYGDAAEHNNSLAEQLWAERQRICGAARAGDEPLEKVLRRMAR